MKKIYLAAVTLLLFSFGFSQTPIVTIDRDNIIGPTTTGNDPTISSVGLTRGAGVALRAGTDFSSNSWTGTSQADAETNDDYMEWSTSASAINDIEIQRIDIRLRRNPNGPTNWQLFYSLDNFATAGVAVNTAVAIPENTNVVTNITGLNIDSGTGGTITFRLYAWGAATNGGWLRVRGQASWSDFGIALPGLRLRGDITTTATNDIESNIIASTFDPSDNIDYNAYNATSGLTTANAIKVGDFTIQDGGDDLTDADTVDTILTDLGFDISNSDNIAAIAIFDGATNIAEITSVSSTVNFVGLTGLTAPDNGSKTFDVYVTFNSTVVDNQQIQLTISAATADIGSGSGFTTFNAGGAQTPIVGDDNRIEVVATALAFDQEPVDSFQFETMSPAPTIITVDANNNQDLDFNGTVSVVSGGSLDPGLINYTITNGLATLDTIVFNEEETATTLITFGGGLIAAVSTAFDINGPLITIAVQDFDGATPEWTYTTDVATFDNGWGTDGYYGVIDIASASPLDNPSFSNNIFGENDLNDEGDNGTTGFATLTLATVDISNFESVKLSFDWDVHGYVNNSDDAQYRLILDGVTQAAVFLLDGNGAIDTDQGTVTVDISDTVSTIGLEIRVRNNGNLGFSGFDNFKLVSVFDGLLYVDNGWSPNPPSGTTGADNAYVLDGTYNVATNIQVNNMYVSDIATTNISAGQSITANSGLVNRGTFELNSVSTSYSSLIANSVEGNIAYNRHVNQFASTGSTTGFNDLVAAPVTNSDQTFLALRTANADIPSGTIGGVPSFLFGPFDNNANDYINYTTSDDPSLIVAGTGYRTASTAAAGSTFRFVGNVETTNNLVPITVGTNSDFNLIGNPYPSYILLSNFLADNSSEFNITTSGIYGYDGDLTNGFTIWNQAYSDANPNAVIAPGQGFFVSSKAGGGTITFNAASRSIGTNDDFIPGRFSDPSLLAHLKLQMSNGSSLFNTDFYFNNNASLSMDTGYDAVMFNNYTPNFAIYSHLVENNNNADLAVQSVQYDALNNVIIPLGINANEGEQLTVSILDTDIPDNIDVYLEDNVTNTFTLLNTSDYVFTPSTTLSGTGRFFLRFSAEALSTPEEDFSSIQIYTTKTPKTLVIKGELNNETKAELFDIQGRMILSTQLDSRSITNAIDISNITSGIYVVKLTNDSQQRAQKVIIK
ncbi:T9SS type A sorting domain-containing protein [uncultured Psychroserpens sp.]|uniref:T9SS type A sorting domain-containing protein n=1 Tax=uncultured Psychroserpens sp. TaxID=255436 RepID=UPI002603FD44|nr:T9SS type A sorting domain-containing protein [uncultured Psychroserpens sp.]